MKIGYIRISTEEQNTARQEVLMQELGVEQVFIDKMSGKNTNRPELKRILTLSIGYALLAHIFIPNTKSVRNNYSQ